MGAFDLRRKKTTTLTPNVSSSGRCVMVGIAVGVGLTRKQTRVLLRIKNMFLNLLKKK